VNAKPPGWDRAAADSDDDSVAEYDTPAPLSALLAELIPKLELLGPLDDDLTARLYDYRLSRPATKAGRLQRALLIRLRVHEREDGGLPTNNRFLFYELEQVGIVSKVKTGKREPHQDTADASAHLRRVGLVPWWWIEDESRQLTAWRTAPSVAEFVAESVNRARIDPWGGQAAPLTICESRSLAGTLRSVAARYCAAITSTNGQSLGHVVSQIAPLLADADRHVLYLGDYDLSGDQIEAHTRRTLTEHGAGWLDWQRIALRADQVAELDAERRARGVTGDLVIRKLDKRYKPAREFDAVECETVGQGPLRRLLTAALDGLLASANAETIDAVLEREDEQRRDVARRLRRMRPRREW
jgi:hypothetical protein